VPTDQDEADALFGGGPAAPAPPAAPSAPSSPFAPRGGADHRKETRVRANWQARVLLPGDRIVALNVYDLSESGIGLVTETGIPAHTVLPIALAMPGLDDPKKIVSISGSIRTTHMTVRGLVIHCGAAWVQIASDQRDLVDQWVRRLRK